MPLRQQSRLLLLRWEPCWLGCSCVQQHEATERHSKANPPQGRPRLPEENLSQDRLKEKTETKLRWAKLLQSLLCTARVAGTYAVRAGPERKLLEETPAGTTKSKRLLQVMPVMTHTTIQPGSTARLRSQNRILADTGVLCCLPSTSREPNVQLTGQLQSTKKKGPTDLSFGHHHELAASC